MSYSELIQYLASEEIRHFSETIRNFGLIVVAFFALLLAVWRSISADKQSKAALLQSEINAEQYALNTSENIAGRYQTAIDQMVAAKWSAIRLAGAKTIVDIAEAQPDKYLENSLEILIAECRRQFEYGQVISKTKQLHDPQLALNAVSCIRELLKKRKSDHAVELKNVYFQKRFKEEDIFYICMLGNIRRCVNWEVPPITAFSVIFTCKFF